MDSLARQTGPSVPSGVFGHTLTGMRALGLETQPILDRVGIDLDRLEERVPLTLLGKFWDATVAVTGESAIGLRLAELARPEMYEVFGYIISRSETLGDALLRATRYLRLLAETFDLSFQLEGDRALLIHRPVHPDLVHTQSSQFIVGCILVVARHITGEHLVPFEVRFMHAKPKDVSAHERLFECPVYWDRPENGFVFSSELLHRPIATRDAQLLALLERQAQQMLDALPKTGQLSLRVQEILAAELQGGNPGAENVASKLGMHPKTLSRRLKTEGTSHQTLLDDLRRNMAERYLRESKLSVGEVAFMLGYSDSSSFNKAFRRWTGTAPQAYRQSAGFST